MGEGREEEERVSASFGEGRAEEGNEEEDVWMVRRLGEGREEEELVFFVKGEERCGSLIVVDDLTLGGRGGGTLSNTVRVLRRSFLLGRGGGETDDDGRASRSFFTKLPLLTVAAFL